MVKDRFKVILSIGLDSAGVHFYKISLWKTAFEHFVTVEAHRFACANTCWLWAWQANAMFDPPSETPETQPKPWTWAFPPAYSRWKLNGLFTQQNADITLKEPTNNTDCSRHKRPFLPRQPHPTWRNLLPALCWNKNHTGLKRLTAELTDWLCFPPAWTAWKTTDDQAACSEKEELVKI